MNINPTLSLDYILGWRPTLPGLTDHDTLAFYHAVIPQLSPACQLVQIGVWRGRDLLFAAELLAALGRPDSRITGVDPYRHPPIEGDLESCTVSYRESLAGLVAHGSEQELRHVQLLRARSVPARRLFDDQTLDLVYIDGDHSLDAVACDIHMWSSAVRQGGVLGGHDYDPAFPGVMESVDRAWPGRVRHYASVWWVEMS